jgi:uncharacterized protein (TIGR00251 family)
MWYNIINTRVQLTILAKPNAKKSACIKIDEQGMHIALHALPHGGEANKVLLDYLSELFDIPKSQIKLMKGQKSRYKQVSMPLSADVKLRLAELNALASKRIINK